MAFYLSVIGGADEGRSFRLDTGDYIIGRSPSAKVILKEESVAWEHALLKVDGVKLTVQNLSAAGTKVKGRKIAEPTRLASHDEIQLSDNCRLLVEQRMSGSGQVSPFLLGLLLVLLLIIVAFGFKQLSAGGVAERPMEPQHWRQAYTRIVDRVEHWTQLGYFPGPCAPRSPARPGGREPGRGRDVDRNQQGAAFPAGSRGLEERPADLSADRRSRHAHPAGADGLRPEESGW